MTKWVGAQNSDDLFISAITVLEIERGILGIQRRGASQGSRLRTWMDSRLHPAFAERVLPINDAIATRCAHLHISDRRNEVDALIAATALVHGLTVVTRNIQDFDDTGVIVIDPWQD